MNSRISLCMVALLCLIIAIAGCTGTQSPAAPAAPTASPVQTAFAGTLPPAGTGASLVPGPVDSLGPRSVNVNIEKDYLGMVHATFQGGPGLGLVKKIDVTLNRADGEVKTSPLGIKVDDTTQLEGTKETDRVIVTVGLNDGKTYTIYDEQVGFKPRP